MVDLTSRAGSATASGGDWVIGAGQKAFWQVYDLGLLVLTIIVIADMPNRWGLASEIWFLVYALFLMRVMMIWPAYFQLLTRNWTILLYPAVCLLSVIWSGSRGTTIVGSAQLIMTFLIASFIGWRFSPKQLIVGVCLIVTAAAAVGLLNWVTGIFQPVYSNVGGLLGIYTNKNMLGHYSQMAAIMSLTVLLMRPGEVPRLLRMAAPLAFGICVFALALSKSMTAVLLLPCYTGLFLLLNRKRLPPALRYGAILTLVAMIGFGPLALAMMGIDPMAEIFRATGKDATLTGRTELWSIAYGLVSKVPLTGYGFGAFWTMTQFENERFAVLQAGATAPSFHNFIADVMIGTGFLGLIAHFTLLVTVVSRALRYYWAAGSALAVGCLVTMLLPINIGMVETYMYRQHEFMLTWIVMLGVSIHCHMPPFVRYSARRSLGAASQGE